jgi:hypothetical protein
MNRQFLIRLFTFLGGIYFFIEYLLPKEIGSFKFNRYNDQITQGFMAVTAMAFGLGLINILFVHGSKIIFKRKGWFNSAGLLVGLLIMLWVTARDWRGSARIAEQLAPYNILSDFALKIQDDIKEGRVTSLTPEQRKNLLFSELQKLLTHQIDVVSAGIEPAFLSNPQFSALATAQKDSVTALQNQLSIAQTQTDPSFEAAPLLAAKVKAVAQSLADRLRFEYQFSFDAALYQLLYDGFFISLGSAMFALLGFYMAAAAYRAFRIRSYESALMMAAAVIVMLGQIPFGIWIWEGFTDIRLWLLSTPSTGAFRAVKFGAAIAGLIMAFRMWLSIETHSFGEQSGANK